VLKPCVLNNFLYITATKNYLGVNHMLFRQANNKEDLKLHDEISRKSWEWEYEVYDRNDILKFLLLDENGIEVGTFDLIPYNPSLEGSVEHVRSFKHIPQIKNNMGYVYEISKLTILKEHRNKVNQLRFVLAIMEACKQIGARYAITLTKRAVYVLMSRFLKIPCERVYDEFYYEKDDAKLIGVVIETQKAFHAEEFYAKTKILNHA